MLWILLTSFSCAPVQASRHTIERPALRAPCRARRGIYSWPANASLRARLPGEGGGAAASRSGMATSMMSGIATLGVAGCL